MSVVPFIVLAAFTSLFLSPLSLSTPDSDALLKFKKSLSNAERLDSWQPNTTPCNKKQPWEGIMCDQGIIDGMHLSHMGLSGKIDVDALLELRTLRTISFVNNSFSGTIPEFNRLGALKALYLSFNKFSGEIPSDFFSRMEALKKVWLSANKFSGKIPESLGKISHLIELHLEQNEFSGSIPVISQKTLYSFDVSNNKLEGQIPPDMSRFGLGSFRDNSGLCGKPLSTVCGQTAPHNNTNSPLGQEESKKSVTGWVVLAVIGLTIVLSLFLRTRQRVDKFKKLRKENLDEVVEVHVPSSNRRTMDQTRLSQKGGCSLKGSNRGKGSAGDLVVVNDHKGVFGLADLMKAAAEVMGNGGLGSAYKAVMANGVAVVVKRVREMNRMSKDTFDAEMRRLGRLRHQNVLTPLAYLYRKDEKLLVCEFVSRGSLLYLLHGEKGKPHTELNWPTRLKIIKGIARGLEFLHSELPSYELPHGNLKSSNILLDSNYEPLLSDYALYPLINNTEAVHSLFAYKSPEAILYQQLSPKCDIYCLGIVILEILTRKFPSQYLSNQKGGTDVVQWAKTALFENKGLEFIDPEIVRNSNSHEEMEKLLRIGAYCCESNLNERIDMKEAIRRIEEIQV